MTVHCLSPSRGGLPSWMVARQRKIDRAGCDRCGLGAQALGETIVSHEWGCPAVRRSRFSGGDLLAVGFAVDWSALELQVEVVAAPASICLRLLAGGNPRR